MRVKDPGGEAGGGKPSTLEAGEACGIEEGLADMTSGCRRRPLARVPPVPPFPVPPRSVGQLAPAFRSRDENNPPSLGTPGLPSFTTSIIGGTCRSSNTHVTSVTGGVGGVEMASDTPEVVLQRGGF